MLLVVLAVMVSQAQHDGDSPILVADQLYWWGLDGGENQAYRIVAKFNSQPQLTSALRLDASIGKFAGRSWILADILVQIDLNANGNVATWIVSGPEFLTAAYVENLRQLYEENITMYDFSVSEVDARPTAYFEGMEE
jgi:hypothetical protein